MEEDRDLAGFLEQNLTLWFTPLLWMLWSVSDSLSKIQIFLGLGYILQQKTLLVCTVFLWRRPYSFHSFKQGDLNPDWLLRFKPYFVIPKTAFLPQYPTYCLTRNYLRKGEFKRKDWRAGFEIFTILISHQSKNYSPIQYN